MFPMIVRIDVDSFQVPVRMSWFGAETQKPMVLYTNAKWLEDLRFMKTSDSAPQGTLFVLQPDSTTGELRPTGSRDLKSSQAYPEEFGHAVAKLWAKYRPSLPGGVRHAAVMRSALPLSLSFLPQLKMVKMLGRMLRL